MRQKIFQITESPPFQNIGLGVVIIYSILVGVSLYFPDSVLLKLMDDGIVGLFVIEILLKIYVSPKFLIFFRDGWNVFDFIVVFSVFIPGVGTTAAAARVLRVFRVLRVVRFLPELQLIVNTLLRSASSMAYIGLLAIILFYVFAVIGTTLFGEASPQFFGTLDRSFLTLFQLITLDAWTDIMASVSHLSPLVPIYFILFILMGTFVILNLFIGVIVNTLTDIREEEKKSKSNKAGV